MKLPPAAVLRPTKAASACPAFLLFGEDRGLVREISLELLKGLVGTTDDPFRVAMLDGSQVKADPARLQDELNALSFGAGRRGVWLREGIEGILGTIESALVVLDGQSPETRAVFLVEAGDLDYKSALRKLFENHPRAAAVQCGGGSDASLTELIEVSLKQAGLTTTDTARAMLMDRLSADRALARQGLEKLILFMGPNGGTVDEATIVSCIADPEMAGYQDVIEAILDGRLETLDHALRSASESGLTPVVLIRAALRSFQRIDQVLRIAKSSSLDAGIAALRPPLPYSARARFAAQCRAWSRPLVDEALTRLMTAEAQCKTTGLPEDVIAGRTLLALALRRRSVRETRSI